MTRAFHPYGMKEGNFGRSQTARHGGTLLAVAILGSLSLGCASASFSRSREQDRSLSLRVNETLSAGTLEGKVEGRAFHGVLTLVGEVASEEARARAGALAREVAGVARVNNMVLVVGDSPGTVGSAPVQGTPLKAARAKTAPAP